MEIGISQHSPSFSSTLLDSIYRSIDQGEDEIPTYTEALRKNKHNYTTDEEMANFRRACMIEKWMEKKAVVRRISAADLQTKEPRKSDRLDYSSWSSSDSSASEAESFPLPRPKPVRTGGSGLEKVRLGQNHREPELDPKPKDEGGFLKTKSRALKIYGDLKKVKQPVSPGGKLAGFLNSLFAGKPKMAARSPSLRSVNASTCSSASSFSRSCLSKTPSKDVKRSVRFSPASEDCQPCGHQNNTKKQASKPEAKSIRNVINKELMAHVMEKNRRVDEAARGLLRNYQMKTQKGRESELSFDNLKKSHVKSQSIHQGYEEEDDDVVSCASSDLFELDNLSAIGMDQRYREELPVYETTQLDHTNRALVNGLIF